MLGDEFGYHVDKSGPVVLIKPKGGGPQLLEEVLRHLWSTFPAQDSVMHTMGMILDGWMKIAAGANGFAISSGSSLEDPILHLPEIENATSEEIAGRIVSLGHKGVWVAWQMQLEPGAARSRMRLVTLSYLEYDGLNLDHFQCE